MVATLVIHGLHVITWITTHLPTQEGWKAELAFLTTESRCHLGTNSHYNLFLFASIAEIAQNEY